MTDGFTPQVEAALTPREPSALARPVLAGACFLVGRNADAARLAGPLRAVGLIDDGAAPGSTWNGLPVFSSADLPEGAGVVKAAS